MKQLARFLTSGAGVVALYVGGVWVGTEIWNLPPRPVNISFYILSTFIAFILAYKWVFTAQVNPKRALSLFLLWQLVGIGLNAFWVEAGLRYTGLFPWIIAASFFAVWPFLSFSVQRHYIFK